MPPGLIIAAPASGSGKTVFTLGLLRHLARSGVAVVSAKVGPDYIDPAFHGAASFRPCRNLDGWAMRRETLGAQVAALSTQAELIVCEGVMGLFDGAHVADGPDGSTADLAALTGWPVLLVMDVRGQAASAAAVLRGFATHRADVAIAGIVFNRAGGEAHRAALVRACARACPEIPVLGALSFDPRLGQPSRHLGLVQAAERQDLDAFLDGAADAVAAGIDVTALRALARPGRALSHADGPPPLPPLGQRIAVATDEAFAFAYPWALEAWSQAGAEILPFSPLADSAPDAHADAVYLPGGYPELHAGRLAGNAVFLAGLRAAAARGLPLFGECGGYMVLGEGLVDAQGRRHALAGLLPLETSFAERRRHLGYRRAVLLAEGLLGATGQAFRGHEFHYATISREGAARPLFACADAAGRDLGNAGLQLGRVAGSFVHLIDRDH